MPKMSLSEQRVFWAKHAVDYVRDTAGIVTSNQGLANIAIWRRATIAGARSTYPSEYNSLGEIRHIAETTKSTKVGNCTEMSAVAFMFLYSQNKEICRPLNWVSLLEGDHAFVIIGKIKDSKNNVVQQWPDDAVICDPWKEKAYNPGSFAFPHLQGLDRRINLMFELAT